MAEEDAVAEATSQLEAAEAEAAALERMIASGDESVGPEDLPKARSLADYWRARTAGAKQRLTVAKEKRRDDAIDALKAEILDEATQDGREIIALVAKAEKALQAVWEAGQAHDAKMDDWWHRAVNLDIPTDGGERGLNPRSYHGIDIDDDVRLDIVKIGHKLSNLMIGSAGPLQPAITAAPESQSVRLATLEDLRHIGKAK